LAGDIPLRNKKKYDLLLCCGQVNEYLILVLNTENLPDNLYEHSFKSIEEWIIKSDTFYTNEKLLELVFNFSETKWYKQVIAIMAQAIVKSSNNKLFLNVSFSQAFQAIKPEEQRFLDSVLNYVLKSKSTFEEQLGDPESEFCKEISDLACLLLENFEIILFHDDQKSAEIFEFIYLILRHSSRTISLRGLEFFTDLKETLQEIRSEVKNADFLLEPYFTASQITMEKAKRALFELNQNGIYEEAEESEIENQETLSKYRDYAEDLFFSTYHIGGLLKGDECKKHFQQIILQRFDASQDKVEFAKNIEVAIFTTRSAIDASDYPEDKLIEVVWDAIIGIKDFFEPTVFYGALGFMADGSVLLPHVNHFLKDSLNYIIEGFSKYHNVKIIQGAVFRALVEISQNGSNAFTEETFDILLNFIETNAALINKEN